MFKLENIHKTLVLLTLLSITVVIIVSDQSDTQNRAISTIAVIVSVLAIFSSWFSLTESKRANELSNTALTLNQRPWFSISNPFFPLAGNAFEAQIIIQHKCGGPAVNIHFACFYNNEDAGKSDDNVILYPGETLTVKANGMLIELGKNYKVLRLKDDTAILDLNIGDNIVFNFSYSDMLENEYNIKQGFEYKGNNNYKRTFSTAT